MKRTISTTLQPTGEHDVFGPTAADHMVGQTTTYADHPAVVIAAQVVALRELAITFEVDWPDPSVVCDGRCIAGSEVLEGAPHGSMYASDPECSLHGDPPPDFYLAVHGMGYDGDHPIGAYATLEDAQLVAEARTLHCDAGAQRSIEPWRRVDPQPDEVARWEASHAFGEAIVTGWRIGTLSERDARTAQRPQGDENSPPRGTGGHAEGC